MKRAIAISLICMSMISSAVNGQIIAGSREDKLFRQISAEPDADARLRLIVDFEREFPKSKALQSLYLKAIDVYRDKEDRAKIIEYGEKVLSLDKDNVNAMLILARNYAIAQKNLDRAVLLAQQAVDSIESLKGQPTPASYSDAQWKAYLQSTDGAAKEILAFVKSVRGN
jgi:tetratricopeptide (TPR) repeat protein